MEQPAFRLSESITIDSDFTKPLSLKWQKKTLKYSRIESRANRILAISSMGRYHCFSTEGKVLWKTRKNYVAEDIFDNPPIYYNGLLINSSKSHLQATDIHTGEVVWAVQGDGGGDLYRFNIPEFDNDFNGASVVLPNGNLLINSQTGIMREINPQGEVLSVDKKSAYNSRLLDVSSG